MNIGQPFAHIVSYLVVDGTKYEIEKFKVNFSQAIDYKGQPQHEVKGGQLIVTLPQMADNNLYAWARNSTQLKNGEVLFQTDMGMSILRINFTNGYCVALNRSINSFTGTATTLVVSSESISMNGIEHENVWKK